MELSLKKITFTNLLLHVGFLYRPEFFEAWDSLMKTNILHQINSNFTKCVWLTNFARWSLGLNISFSNFHHKLTPSLIVGHVIKLNLSCKITLTLSALCAIMTFYIFLTFLSLSKPCSFIIRLYFCSLCSVFYLLRIVK